MAHKVMIGGTSYNIVGGRSLINGTGYNISCGRTLVNGTGYDILFAQPLYAMLYTDGSFEFQLGSGADASKTLINSYTGFENVSYISYNSVPWYSNRQNIVNVSFLDEVSVTSMA